MNDLSKILALVLFLNLAFAPSRSNAADTIREVVKWDAVAGNDNEFVIYMPSGYATASEGGFVVGKPGEGGRVQRKITAFRYINGVVLMMDYYEGDAKPIEKSLQAAESSSGESRQVNGFDVSQFESTSNGYVTRKQYFRIKNRLYVVRTVSKGAVNPIADGFFKSVHLVNGKATVRPNMPDGATSLTLKGITEQDSVGTTAGTPINADLADRKVIVVHSPRLNLPRGNIGGTGGKVRLKILYSANGKVSDVEVLESPSKAIAKAATEAAKNIVFVPAEKDEKLVAAYDVLEYSFTSSMGGFIL